jgi:hypothetical protein
MTSGRRGLSPGVIRAQVNQLRAAAGLDAVDGPRALPADGGTLGTFGTLLRKTEGVDTRHQRSMQKWDAYSKQWATIQKSLALQVGRQPEHLVMERLDAYRKRIEMKDAMGQAVPADVSKPASLSPCHVCLLGGSDIQPLCWKSGWHMHVLEKWVFKHVSSNSIRPVCPWLPLACVSLFTC